MTETHSHATALLGALVADAATLGLHWIYDVNRLEEIAARQDREIAFTPVLQGNYEGIPAYFAHGARLDGELSQYGETLRLGIQSMITSGGQFDVTAYQKAYAAHFGAGGSYQGYIDRPTRGTLENIAAGKLTPSGVDDDQLPAITRLPAIVAAGGDPARIKAAIEVTNVNPHAQIYGAVAADLLTRVFAGESLPEALKASADSADATIRARLSDALDTPEQSSVAYGETTGRACHLEMAMPLVFHILRDGPDYKTAVERNILAGGDSAGRAILVGAVTGALYGISGAGIPLDWILATDDAAAIWEECRELADARA